ncbi:Brp/Blh family beta-carotene 15,15'-dioxygenase [Streptomyces sp. NPDC051133]|uniref:Brp/Blh family beta-carotene 15,15'-dioxygenase n=1 Tax=Streptomyces sp. NPDC051133 TaxID=3155521 RepID=UPI00342A912B
MPALTPQAPYAVSAGIAVAGIALGLPHGAVDHLLPPRRTSARRAFLSLCNYVAAATAMAAVVMEWPRIGLLVFLLVSAIHLGAADSAFHAWRSRRQWKWVPRCDGRRL